MVLVADKSAEYTLKGIFDRYQSLSIRPVKPDIFTHPGHDSGCYHNSHQILRLYINSHKHAIVLFDKEGSGGEVLSTLEIEHRVEDILRHNGWDDRAKAIVLDPELEIWVWATSPHVPAVLGWNEDFGDMRRWLAAKGYWPEDALKPPRPKEALQCLLRQTGKSLSASLFQKIASRVGLSQCLDPGFLKFRSVLAEWFPAD